MPPKTPTFLDSLRTLFLLPYVIISAFLLLCSAAEWFLCRAFCCGVGQPLLSTRFRRQVAEKLGIPDSISHIQGLLLPTRRIRQSATHRDYVRHGDEMLREVEEEIRGCKAMLTKIRNERLEIQRTPSSDVEKYLQKIAQSQRIYDHLKILERSSVDILHYSRTQAVFDYTGYRGFADWAEKTSKTHEHILVTIGQVAFIGASLTYGTIFGSSRGNVGLMCYAFALFDCGFIVPTVALVLLKWAALRPRDMLFGARAPWLWRVVLNLFVFGSVTAVVAAICILNVTLVLLRFPDLTLELDIAPAPAGSLALGCLGLAVVVTMVAAIFHHLANGWKFPMFAVIPKEAGQGLNDYALV